MPLEPLPAPPRLIATLAVHSQKVFRVSAVAFLLAAVGSLVLYWPILVKEDFQAYLQCDGPYHGRLHLLRELQRLRKSKVNHHSRRLHQERTIPKFFIRLIYTTRDGSNIFTPEHLTDIRDIESRLQDLPSFREMCFADGGGRCVLPLSVVNYFFASVHGSQIVPDGRSRTILPIQAILARLGKSNSYFVDRYFGVSQGQLESALTGNITRSVFRFGIPLRGISDPEDPKQGEKFAEFVSNELYPFLTAASTKNVRVYYYGEKITQVEVESAVWHDAAYAIGSLSFIFCYLVWYLRSLSLAAAALACIALSFPLSYAGYCLVYGHGKMIAINFLSFFVVLGVGADDVFVLHDVWVHSRPYGNGEMALARRLWSMYCKAGMAIFATSATTAASFFANIASSIGPLRQFGFFMGTCITVNWIIVAALYPLILVNHDRSRSKGAAFLRSGEAHGVQMEEQLVEASLPHEEEEEERTASRGGKGGQKAVASVICLLGLAGTGWALYAAVGNLKPANGVPQFFPKESNLGALQDLQMRFGNETSVATEDMKLCHGAVQGADKPCDEVVEHTTPAPQPQNPAPIDLGRPLLPQVTTTPPSRGVQPPTQHPQQPQWREHPVTTPSSRPVARTVTWTTTFPWLPVAATTQATTRWTSTHVALKTTQAILPLHTTLALHAAPVATTARPFTHTTAAKYTAATPATTGGPFTNTAAKTTHPATSKSHVPPQVGHSATTTQPMLNTAAKTTHPAIATRQPEIVTQAATTAHLTTKPTITHTGGSTTYRPWTHDHVATTHSLAKPARHHAAHPTTTLSTLPVYRTTRAASLTTVSRAAALTASHPTATTIAPWRAPPHAEHHSTQQVTMPPPMPSTTRAARSTSGGRDFDVHFRVEGHSSQELQDLESFVKDQLVQGLSMKPEDLSFDVMKGRRLQEDSGFEVTLHFHHLSKEKEEEVKEYLSKNQVLLDAFGAHDEDLTTSPALPALHAEPSPPPPTTPSPPPPPLPPRNPVTQHMSSPSGPAWPPAPPPPPRPPAPADVTHHYPAPPPPPPPPPAPPPPSNLPASFQIPSKAPHIQFQKREMPHDRQGVVNLLFGVRQAADGSAFELDPSFDFSAREAQLAIVEFCDRISKAPELKVVDGQWNCWPMQLKQYLLSRHQSFPTYAAQQALHRWLEEAPPYVGNDHLDIADDGSVSWLLADFRVLFDSHSSGRQIKPYMDTWETTVSRINAEILKTIQGAEFSMGTPVPVSEMFQRSEAEIRVVGSALSSWLVSVACAMAALAVFTRSVGLSALACFAMFATAACSLFFITSVFKWRFGLMEAVSLIIFCGFSVDYPLHVVQAYVLERDKGAGIRIALREVGGAVASGCFTTCGAAAFLLLCEIRIFTRFGQVLIVNMLFALVFALLWIPAVLELCRCQGSAAGKGQASPAVSEASEAGYALGLLGGGGSSATAAGVLAASPPQRLYMEVEPLEEGFAALGGGTPRGGRRS